MIKLDNKVAQKRRITGQGMTEYIIVVALIAIAAIAAVGYFGGVIQHQFNNLGLKMSGETATDVGLKPKAATAKNLKDYKN